MVSIALLLAMTPPAVGLRPLPSTPSDTALHYELTVGTGAGHERLAITLVDVGLDCVAATIKETTEAGGALCVVVHTENAGCELPVDEVDALACFSPQSDDGSRVAAQVVGLSRVMETHRPYEGKELEACLAEGMIPDNCVEVRRHTKGNGRWHLAANEGGAVACVESALAVAGAPRPAAPASITLRTRVAAVNVKPDPVCTKKR